MNAKDVAKCFGEAAAEVGFSRKLMGGFFVIYVDSEIKPFFMFEPFRQGNRVVLDGRFGISIDGVDNFVSLGARGGALPPLFAAHVANLSYFKSVAPRFLGPNDDVNIINELVDNVAYVLQRMPMDVHQLVSALATKTLGVADLKYFIDKFSVNAQLRYDSVIRWCASHGEDVSGLPVNVSDL